MTIYQRVLLVDPATGFYRTRKYPLERYFGPVDLGIHLASNLRSLVKEHYFLTAEGYRVRVTASFGVASYPSDAQSKLALIRLADKAMYDVKESTRDAVKTA